MNLNSSKLYHFDNSVASFFISSIIANLSSIDNPVIARSMSLDSSAKPVVNEPNRTT